MVPINRWRPEAPDLMDWLLLAEAIAFLGFLMLSAFFSASETALTSISKFHAKKITPNGNGTSPLDVWIQDPNRILATLLVGNNIANVGASILAAFIAETLFSRAGLPQYRGIAGFTAFAFTTSSLLIFGEIIPKIYAKQHSERVASRVILYLNLFYSFPLKPFIRFFLGISNFVVRFFGGKTSAEGPFLTQDDIKTLIEVSQKEGVLEEEEREMIHSIIEFGDTIAKEVMVPRTDMVRLNVNTKLRESLETAVAAGHSRIPVYEERIDNIIGILYVKDLLAYWHRALKEADDTQVHNGVSPGMEERFDLRSLLRNPVYVPETKKVSELLHEFQQQRTHMAIVVDEYGGTAGLITIEDVLEEIVGEIHDEYDREGALYRQLAEDRYEVDARISLFDLKEELEIDLPEGEDFETLSGFISSVAGCVPEVGEVITWERYKMTILEGDERRITRVRIDREPQQNLATNASDSIS